MKKFIFGLMALLAVSAAGNAQITSLNIGYCDGRVSTTVHKEFCSPDKDVWVSAAIWLPASEINVNAGNEIKAVNAGLAQKIGIDTMCVWIREGLDEPNLAEGGIPKAEVKKGWNEIGLDVPLALDGTNTTGLYIGYSYHQSSVNQGLSTFLEPMPNALFVKHGDGEWADRSDEGLLCVEGLVYGENLPKLNLKLISIDAPDFFILDKGNMIVSGKVKNAGVQTVTGFDVMARVDGVDEVYTAHIDSVLNYQDVKYFEFEITPAIQSAGKGGVTVTITKLDEGDDLNMEDNVASDEFETVLHDYTHVVLLEEFTGEQCQNCPRVAGYVHDILEKEKYKNSVAALCHHEGYYSDFLTVPCAGSYLWYYNAGGSTYAPAVMVDRYTAPGGSTPVFNPTSQSQLESAIDQRHVTPAFVSLNIKASIDNETNKIKVIVNGSRAKEDLCVHPARITVYLVENNIPARNQAGATGEFIHQHAVRKVNSDWGSVIEWEGNDYNYECALDLRADYVRENLQVIAMIFDYDSNDATKNDVKNAAMLSYADFDSTLGISSVKDSDTQRIVYDLQGRKIMNDNLRPGIYIINGRKEVVR